MKNLRVAVIGLGLIGGSLAKAFKERLGITDIVAVNRSRASLDKAIADKTITDGFTEVNEQVLDSDIIFICLPIKSVIDHIDQIMDKLKPNCVLTDVSSTKGEIMNHVNSFDAPPCFIGGHPMAGKEKSGYGASSSDLFENAYYILTPSKSTTEPSMELLLGLIKGIGAVPVEMNPDQHDAMTAAISHVPHVVASALVNIVSDMGENEGNLKMFAAGGFRDITRIASSNPEIWENIILSNREKIKGVLQNFVETLNKFNYYIDNNSNAEIFNFFASAKTFRDSI